jgi:hypothetical protein
MKKLLTVLILVICLFCFSSLVFANSGSAIIPCYWTDGPTLQTFFFISNITSSEIHIKITLFKDDGTILNGSTTGYGKIENFQNNLTDCSISFTLGPNKSGYFGINAAATNGYGIIQWDQNSSTIKGLVAHGEFNYYNGNLNSRFSIPINNGLPF